MRLHIPILIGLALLTGCGSTQTTDSQPIRHALISTDGRTITVPVSGGGCTSRAELVVAATQPAVRLRAQTVEMTGLPCAAVGLLLQASTTLTQPLGARTLIDDTTGSAIPYISGRILSKPTYLPPGLVGPVDRPYNGWTRVYTFSTASHLAPLDIVETPGPKTVPDLSQIVGTPPQSVLVNGHRATLIAERGTTGRVLIGWTDGNYSILVSSAPEYTTQRALAAHIVLEIARGLRPPG